MNWEEVVEVGRELPSTEASTSYGTPALKAKGKLLTRLRPEDGSLVLLGVPPEEREMLIEADPDVFHVTPHYDGYQAVLARLDALDRDRQRAFLLRRWREVAPRRLVAGFDQDAAHPASPSPERASSSPR